MTATLDLATSPVLSRAANLIVSEGHTKGDFVTGDGYCAAGAIGEACGLQAEDWYDEHDLAPKRRDYTVNGDFDDEAYESDYRDWRNGRAASLAALRTLAGDLYPDSRPEETNRNALIAFIGRWNDDDARTTDQVVTAMRQAAREAVTSRG